MGICSSDIFSINPLDNLAAEFTGSTVSWERKPSANIEPALSGAGSGNINEQLTNTGIIPVEVIYLLTFTSDKGCKNITPYELKVNVYPKAKLTNSPTSFEINCGETFTFNAQSNMNADDIEFGWEMAAVDGITNPQASGNSGNINEVLHNETGETKNVIYKIILKIDECESIENITVKPKIGLSSDLNPSPICSEELFDNIVTSNVSGITYSWVREAVDGINGNTGGSGSSHLVKETLINEKKRPLPLFIGLS